MTIKGCNAAVHVKKAFYSIVEDSGLPALIEVALDFSGQEYKLLIPLQQYTAKGLCNRYPLLRISNKKAFDSILIEDLISKLSNGSVQRGLYFEKAGANILPDGQLCFVHGPEVIGPISVPYAVSDEVSKVYLIGKNCPVFPLVSLLLTSPPQTLLTLAYVLLSSIRSLLIESGINLQAALYVLGGQGLGKTTLATRIAGIYKRGGDTAGMIQLGSTSAATNALLASLRDQPAIVDDLCLSASPSEKKERLRLAAKLLRQATSDIPIIKKQGGRTIELPCAAGLVVTAEFPLENLSDLTRCIFVPIQAPLDLPDELTSELIGTSVRHYLRWFTEHFPAELNEIRNDMDSMRDFPLSDARMATNYTCLNAVFRSFLRSLHVLDLPAHVEKQIPKRMDAALAEALSIHQNLISQLKDHIPVGNLSFCLLEGYKHGAFDLASKLKKLDTHDGVLYKDDLCLRSDVLVQFVRQQPGYHDWSRNRIVQALKDINALVIQEEKTATVRLAKGLPRVYRIRLKVLRDDATKY